MKCQEVQKLLVAYLDGEITPSERKLIQAHLAGCAVCQQQVAALAATSSRLGQALLRRGARAAPSPQAWSRLEARLAREAHPAPSRLRVWLAHLAPMASRAFTLIFSGGVTMRKRLVFAALVAVLAMAAVGVLTLNMATPVSAQEILNRAYAAQTAVESQGIQHMKTEFYTNPQAMPGPKPSSGKETKSILESYVDQQTGKTRTVVTDATTGQVISASAFDGTYLYTSGDLGGPVTAFAGASTGGMVFSVNVGDNGPVHTIYRMPKPKGMQNLAVTIQGGPVDAKTLYEAARKDPTAKFIGEQTLSDGRKVYVLQLQHLAQMLQSGPAPANSLPAITSTLYFDKQTYQLVQQQDTIQQNGKEVVFNSIHQLVQETLPSSTRVAWDLSDLKGITVVDDPKGEHGPKLPVTISQQELAARNPKAYILKTVPEGYTMEITAAPIVNKQDPGAYHITYRNSSGDNIMITGGGMLNAEGPQNAKDTYTTRSGLKLRFLEGAGLVSGAPQGAGVTGGMFAQTTGPKQGAPTTHAMVQAPDGTTFDLASTLPRDKLQALAEDLVLLK